MQVCSTVSEQQCETVQTQQCNTVNEQVCADVVQEQQCRTVQENQCNLVDEEFCRDVSSPVCTTRSELECSTQRTLGRQSTSRPLVPYSPGAVTIPSSIKALATASRVVSVTTFGGQPSSRSPKASRRIDPGLLSPNRESSGSSNSRGSFAVGRSTGVTTGIDTSEEELKETFLATGIFQRKPGDPLDGRRRSQGKGKQKTV